MIASTFGGVHDFFHSSTWYVARNLAIFFVIVFWVASVYWVFKDARRRIADKLIVGVVTAIGIVPFIGPLIYMLFRPPEYLEDIRERELEIKAIERRLGEQEEHCSVCGATSEPTGVSQYGQTCQVGSSGRLQLSHAWRSFVVQTGQTR